MEECLMEQKAPRLLKFKDSANVFRNYNSPQSKEYPFVAYEALAGANFRSHILMVRRGGGRPRHRINAEHLLVVLEGEAEFEFDGSVAASPARMAKCDALLIPADVDFSFRQVGWDDLALLAMVIRKDVWPHTSSGYETE
jgi:mannose-6-phosphate isomerase-like protein (cupin superfamily)